MHDEIAPEFWAGVEQFNQQEFYACHDTIEAIWMEAMEPQKTFYQGVLQIAVALYHLSNHNLRGATILLGEGVNRLRRYPTDYGAIDVSGLIGQSAALLHQLQVALSQSPDPQAIEALAQSLPLPKIDSLNSPDRSS